MEIISNFTSNSRKVESDSTLYTNNLEVDVQNPFPTDGDSVYVKDVKTSLNNIGTFTGDLNCLFNNIDDAITDTSSTNPKYIEFYLERPISTGHVGLVAHTGNFSNVKIILKDRQGTVLATKDESGSNTHYTARRYAITGLDFCCIRIEFHTADPITLSFLRIAKYINTSSRIKALNPAGTEVEIQATTGGNLKMSLQEFDGAVATNTNQLNVAPFVRDENGVYTQLLGDTMYGGALVEIPVEHHEIHCGDSYTLTRIAALGNGATDILLLIVPDETASGKKFHLTVSSDFTTDCTYELFEGPTTTGNGTGLTWYNRERNNSNTTTLAAYHTPTVTGNGTLLYTDRAGTRTTGGSVNRGEEFVLKNNTKYLVKITNNVSTTGFVSWKLNHYIHPGV